MTPQELKNSILQLAIQGKLVEQRPEEGTAEALFAQIQQEKQRLIAEKKIKKEKPLPEITDEEKPFDIPESWMWVRLGRIITLLSGQDMTASEYNEQGKGIPYITGASNVSKEGLIINRWTECAKAVAHRGDMLLTCKGTVGKTLVLQEESVHIARQIMAIKSPVSDIHFIQYFIESQIKHLKSQAKSMIPGIERNNVLMLPISLPPLAEQKRIVAKIEELLPYIDRYEQAWSKLEQFNSRFPEDMKKSLLQYAIQGKLVEQRPEEGTAEELFAQIQQEKQWLIAEKKIKKEKPLPEITEEEKPFDIPESWKWVRLSEVANVIGGYAFKSTSFCNSGVRVIRISDFNENGFINKKIVRHPFNESLTPFLLKEKNILLCMTGGTVGKSYFVKNIDEPMMTNQRVATIKIMVAIEEYINFVILSPVIQKIIQLSKNSTNDNISMDTINSFTIPLPPLAEQKRIVEKLEQLLPLCDRLK